MNEIAILLLAFALANQFFVIIKNIAIVKSARWVAYHHIVDFVLFEEAGARATSFIAPKEIDPAVPRVVANQFANITVDQLNIAQK